MELIDGVPLRGPLPVAKSYRKVTLF
jgi:hypothetical protein